MKKPVKKSAKKAVKKAVKKQPSEPRLYLLEPAAGFAMAYCAKIVVRARSTTEARQLASDAAGDEGPGFWLDSVESECNVLPVKGKSEVVCAAYADGYE